MNKKYLIPINAITIYMVVALILYFFGPIKYSTRTIEHSIVLLIYVIVFLVISNVVYRNTLIKRQQTRTSTKGETTKRDITIAKVAIIFSCILQFSMLVEYQLKYGMMEFSLGKLFQLSANAYVNIEYQYTITNLIQSYTYVMLVACAVLGTVYYRKIGKIYRVMYLAVICFFVIRNTLYNGEQKAIIDLLIYIMVGFGIQYSSNVRCQNINEGEKGIRRNRHKKIAIVICGVIAVIYMFGMLGARLTTWEMKYNMNSSLQSGMSIDYDNLLIKFLPDNIKQGVSSLIIYLTHGYEGLSLSLSLPFKWSVFMGSSWKIQEDVLRWFSLGTEWFAPSYPVRAEIEYGYRSFSQWHTIFPWLASDFTFIGAIAIVCSFLRRYALVWKECLNTNKAIPCVYVAQFAIMWFHILGTNYLFIKREFLVSTLMISVAMYISRRIKFTFKKSDRRRLIK